MNPEGFLIPCSFPVSSERGDERDHVIDGLVSLVLVDYNAGPGLLRCLASVFERDDVTTEVILVDNASSDRSALEALDRYPEIHLIQNSTNLGFARAANRGLALARGEWIGLLNPDVEISPGALGKLVAFLTEHPRVGAVGPALVCPDGTPQPYSHGGDPSPAYLARRAWARLNGRALHVWAGGGARPVDWVCGACLLARCTVWQQVGLLDESFFLYFEDVDWCRRCRDKGFDVYFVPEVAVTHLSRPDYHDRSRRRHYFDGLKRYYRKYYGPLVGLALNVALVGQR
jgi:GT2 family glycosyltransferase